MDAVTNWYKKPFDDEMDVKDWFLFIGMLTILGVVWNLILFNLKEFTS